MTSPDVFIAATAQTGDVVQVEWRVGTAKPKGIVNVTIPAGAPAQHVLAIAELAAIKYLVDNQKVGTSLRTNRVTVSQRAVKDLLRQKAEDSSLIPYGRHLYLLVTDKLLEVAKPKWAEGIEIDPARIFSTTAGTASWPGGYCDILKAEVGITRHAVERFIERGGVRNDYWVAYQKIVKALGAKTLRIVSHKEIAKTNPGMRYDGKTKILHHQASEMAFVLVQDHGIWVLATVHHFHQEFIPTLVRGRIEYRRAI